MARLIRDDERLLVFRVAPGKVAGGVAAALVGLAICFGLIGEGEAWSFDRLTWIGVGLVMVLVGLGLAGPEDLVLDLANRTYRLRTGLLFLARWREGPLDDLAHLELRKESGATAWSIRLVWSVPRRRPFAMDSVRDTGTDGKDPRLWLCRRMEAYARRLGIPAQDQTGRPLELSPPRTDDPRQAAAAVLGAVAAAFPPAQERLGEAQLRLDEALTKAGVAPTAPAAAPPLCRAAPGAPVEVRTRRHHVRGAGGKLTLAKSRWFILEGSWQNVLWAAMAGPTLGYILGRARVWRVFLEAPEQLRKTGLLPGAAAPSNDPNPHGALVLALFVLGAVGLMTLLCLAAWVTLLKSAWRVARGETFVFERDQLSYNGADLARSGDVRSVEVRGHEEADDDSTRSWHNLCLILADDRRITLASGEQDEMSRLGIAIAGYLGVPAVAR
jgi:hypothetical protein